MYTNIDRPLPVEEPSLWSEHGCPVCSSTDYSGFCEFLGVPVEDGALWPTAEQAYQSPRGDIKLTFCRNCGYIGNRVFDQSRLVYDQTYDFSLHFSPHFQAFAQELAAGLVERHHLRGKTILEIGCGRGEFLRTIVGLSGGQGIGFDPSFVPTAPGSENESDYTFIPELYSERQAHYQADFICCRHVLTHLADPLGFVRMVRRAIGGRTGTGVYFEVPSAAYTFEHNVIWSIIYPHCSWFGAEALTRLFNLAGFEVTAVRPCFDQQYLGVEAVAVEVPPLTRPDPSGLAALAGQLDRFAANYRQIISGWRSTLEAITGGGQRVVAWGAGARAISFLNLYKIREEIGYVVDINPKRQRAYLPVTGQQVVAPQFLVDYRPDTIIITNPTFEAEIKQQVAELGLRSNFLVL